LIGNVYYTNDINKIVAREISNPVVMQHLRALPEDTDRRLQELYQAHKWLYDPFFQTPMVRFNNLDYYQLDACEVTGERDLLKIGRFFLKDREVWAQGFRLKRAVDVRVSCTSVRDLVLMKDATVQLKVAHLGPPVLVGIGGHNILDYNLISKNLARSQSAVKILIILQRSLQAYLPKRMDTVHLRPRM
jgi:hypothetical protein